MTRIATVNDYMATDLTTFLPSDNVHNAVRKLLEKKFSGAPVVDQNGELIGVLSKKDCLQVVYSASYHQDWGGNVSEYMNSEIETIASGTDIIKAADRFVQSSFRRFPVLENGHMIGQISRTDILRALYDQ